MKEKKMITQIKNLGSLNEEEAIYIVDTEPTRRYNFAPLFPGQLRDDLYEEDISKNDFMGALVISKEWDFNFRGIQYDDSRRGPIFQLKNARVFPQVFRLDDEPNISLKSLLEGINHPEFPPFEELELNLSGFPNTPRFRIYQFNPKQTSQTQTLESSL